jgi:TRAP-type C4-dicarboxylate transport system substrate-binding protein
MMHMRLVGALAGLLLGWRASAAEIKIAQDCPPDPQRCGSHVFASALAQHLKASGLQVKELPVNSIGGEAERLDQTTQGLLEINMADLARAGQLDKSMFGFSSAYMFDSAEHLDRATSEGKLLDRINANLSKKGIRVVALVLVGGGTGIFNTRRAVTKPEDMADLRMRALDENQLKLFQSWGSNGVVITMPEVATAFQTGTAHGYVNPPFVPFLFGHADILKHYTDAKMSMPTRVAMVSEDWYKGLSANDRKIVDEGVAKATAANRAWVGPSDEAALAQLEKAGVTITRLTPEARASFREKSRPAWTALLSQQEIQPFIEAAEKVRR